MLMTPIPMGLEPHAMALEFSPAAGSRTGSLEFSQLSRIDSSPRFVGQGSFAAPAAHSSAPVGGATPDRAAAAAAAVGNPAICAWILRLVEDQVEQACRLLREGDFASGLSQQATLQARWVTQQAQAEWDESRRHLESQVNSLAAQQGQLLSVVEGLSAGAGRRESSGDKAGRTVEKLLGAVDELHRSVEQDGGDVAARLKHQAAEFKDFRKSWREEAARQQTAHAELREEVAKQRIGQTELRRLHSEAAAQQQQCCSALAGACATITATRQEVVDLTHVVQRVEQGISSALASWRKEASANARDTRESARKAAEQVRADSAADLAGLRRELETWQVCFRQECASEQRQLTAELRAEWQACFSEQRAEQQQFTTELRAEVHGCCSEQQQLTTDLRAETLALVENKRGAIAALDEQCQGAVSALDEQLWRTEQRLGQRLDELAHVADRRESLAAMADLVARSAGPLLTEEDAAKAAHGSRQAPSQCVTPLSKGHRPHGSPLARRG